VRVMYLSDQKGWILSPPLPRHHLRVGNGGKDTFLGILASLRLSEGKLVWGFFLVGLLFSFLLISVPVVVVFEQILTCCNLESCCSAVVMLSIIL